MLCLMVLCLTLPKLEAEHYDLGKSEGLALSLDLDIEVEESAPYKELTYAAHFCARDSKGGIVDEKRVELGMTTDEPEGFHVEDRFGKGYKQVFISLHFASIRSYLFAFKDRHFYAAFVDDCARDNVKVLKSRCGAWKLDVSKARKNYVREAEHPKAKLTTTSISRTFIVEPDTKPLINTDL
ncbi:MAG: hypothetical protein JST12_19495 [Armatimonadetes bacterium]|nr:hypothetical protein [Armatimonadota bacterium]MBS1726234.1 hypothetical protein [Armatimonadota bacterium]